MDTIFGLKATESDIYRCLLRKGEQNAVQLSKDLKIHRRTIYDNLNMLVIKGYVTKVMHGKTHVFKASNPRFILRELEQKKSEFEKELPSLLQLYNARHSSVDVSVYLGIDGAKALLQDVISSKSKIYWFGAGGILFDALQKNGITIKRELLALDIVMIQPQRLKTEYFTKQIRFIPKKYSFNSNMSFVIFGDTVAIGTLTNNELFLIKISGEEFAKGFKNYFNLMWEISTS